MVKFLLATLAIYKLSMVLVHEKWGDPIRDRLGKVWMTNKVGIPVTWLGRTLSCFFCTSFLAAVVVFTVLFYKTPAHALLGACAASGGVELLYIWSGSHRLFRVKD